MLAGEVHFLEVRFPYDDDSMPKFLVCVDPAQCLFMTINTRPPHAPGAGVLITPADMGFLNHDSYIDTSLLHELDADGLVDAIAQANSSRGMLPNRIRQAIKEAVQEHGILPATQEQVVLANL